MLVLVAAGLYVMSVYLWQDEDTRERTVDMVTVDASAIVVDMDDSYTGFEGWGTSLAWWGHMIGQWEDDAKFHELMDLIFDPDRGIGINIVRYNIGGGENPNIVSTLRPGGDVPGFQPEEGVWDWEADAGQRRVLLESIERGVNITEAFSNSPPYWMTVSGSVTGAANGRNNLKEEYQVAFADYLTEVVKYYADRHGVVFRTLAPFNEPTSNWWRLGNIQEGAHFNVAMQEEVLRHVHASLQEKGLTATTLSTADSNSIDETIEIIENYSEETFDLISQINAHSYNGAGLLELRELSAELGKKLWMSEYGTGGTEEHNHEDLSSVLELAQRIIFDLRILQPAAWIYWQAVEDESAKNNWGWMHAEFLSDEADYEITKQYYAMGQFSKFIRPGNRIITTSDGRTVAAHDEQLQRLVIVTYNERSVAQDVSFDLSAFTYESREAHRYITSAMQNMDRDAISISTNGFSLEVAPQSIVTIVVEGVTPASS